jgi:hypothetical protein
MPNPAAAEEEQEEGRTPAPVAYCTGLACPIGQAHRKRVLDTDAEVLSRLLADIRLCLDKVGENANRLLRSGGGTTWDDQLSASCTGLFRACLHMYSAFEEGLNFTDDVQRGMQDVACAECSARSVLSIFGTFPQAHRETAMDMDGGNDGGMEGVAEDSGEQGGAGDGASDAAARSIVPDCHDPAHPMHAGAIMHLELLLSTLDALREEMIDERNAQGISSGPGMGIASVGQRQHRLCSTDDAAMRQARLTGWMQSRKRRCTELMAGQGWANSA